MPLKLVYGRKKTKAGNIYIRGSYLGIRVDKSSGTNRGRVAGAKLSKPSSARSSSASTPRAKPRLVAVNPHS